MTCNNSFCNAQDTTRLKDYVAEAKRLNELGGDWDRRNRLKVYEAYYLLAIRDLKGVSTAACLATKWCCS
jgi:hypothetical protein